MDWSKRSSIVVAGASLAGMRTAEELRRLGFVGSLTLIGEERHFPPFDRPPLSKDALAPEANIEAFRLRAFHDLDASFELGLRADRLDLSTHEITLSNGGVVGFDGLVIATGASVRRLRCPGSGLAGVHYVRTIEHCRSLGAALAERPRVVVVGAGFIGSEVAAACRKRGLQVTIIDADDLPMSEKVGPLVARFLMDQHVNNGCALHLGDGIAAIIGDTRVRGVQLSSGAHVEADLVVIGIGVRPETDWLSDSGLEIQDGVSCDEYCRAEGASEVVAVGDVARWRNPRYGDSMRVEHWTNAVEQAEYAAAILLDGPQNKPPYAPVPYYWSDQYDLKVQFAGVLSGSLHLVEGSVEERRFLMASTDSTGNTTGALAVNWPSRLLRCRRALAAAEIRTEDPVRSPS